MIECKGKSPGGTVSLEEVTNWLGKLPIVQDYVASREHLRERNQTYAFWTTGAFETDALDKLKSEQAAIRSRLETSKHRSEPASCLCLLFYSSAGTCPFHKLELYEIGELPATGMLWSSSCRTF